MVVMQGILKLDLDQQDYLGVLLGAPDSFGSQAGSRALAPDNAQPGK